MFTIYGAILALCSFLLGFAWGRRVPEPSQTAKRAEHKADHLAAQVKDHEDRLRALEDPSCPCGDPDCGKVTT